MQAPFSKPHVVIYSRPGCHLCEELKQTIASAGCEGDYTLSEINIETDSELLACYRYDIPVVTINGEQAFKHRVTAEQFKSALRRKV